MSSPKSLTGVISLPDAKLNFHLSFGDGNGPTTELKGAESKMIGHILNQALRSSPEMQELLINFADYLKGAAEKAQQGDGQEGEGQGS